MSTTVWPWPHLLGFRRSLSFFIMYSELAKFEAHASPRHWWYSSGGSSRIASGILPEIYPEIFWDSIEGCLQDSSWGLFMIISEVSSRNSFRDFCWNSSSDYSKFCSKNSLWFSKQLFLEFLQKLLQWCLEKCIQGFLRMSQKKKLWQRAHSKIIPGVYSKFL